MVTELEVGAALPSERVLAQEFGVSRMTLRRAFDDLRRTGYVVRRQGSGTYASRPKISHELMITSFTEDMQRLGLTSRSKVVSHRHTVAGASLGAKLKVSPDEPVWQVVRLRIAGDEPMAIEWLSVPQALVPDLTVGDLETHSYYELLNSRYGLHLAGGRQRIEATVTDAEESALLDVALHSPALLVDRVVWADEGPVVEHVRSVYRGDRYSFAANLRPPGFVT